MIDMNCLEQCLVHGKSHNFAAWISFLHFVNEDMKTMKWLPKVTELESQLGTQICFFCLCLWLYWTLLWYRNRWRWWWGGKILLCWPRRWGQRREWEIRPVMPAKIVFTFLPVSLRAAIATLVLEHGVVSFTIDSFYFRVHLSSRIWGWWRQGCTCSLGRLPTSRLHDRELNLEKWLAPVE